MNKTLKIITAIIIFIVTFILSSILIPIEGPHYCSYCPPNADCVACRLPTFWESWLYILVPLVISAVITAAYVIIINKISKKSKK